MFKELIERTAHALDRAGIPYMLIGGQAVLHYGEPRFTKDIDLTLGVDASGLGKVVGVVAELGLTLLVRDADAFVRRTMVLPVIDAPSGIRVDLIFSNSAYEAQAIGRARSVPFDQTPVRVASLEDVVIHKVIAGRPRDLDDVRTVLLKNPGYDRRYIMRWLRRFDGSLQEAFCRTFEGLEKASKG